MKVVVNTSPLIALERIGCLSVLPRLYETVIRPQSVLDELKAGGAEVAVKELVNANWILTADDPEEMVTTSVNGWR
jgi:predicted nucleic acid-binding protein